MDIRELEDDEYDGDHSGFGDKITQKNIERGVDEIIGIRRVVMEKVKQNMDSLVTGVRKIKQRILPNK
jgi:hypothetical protein